MHEVCLAPDVIAWVTKEKLSAALQKQMDSTGILNSPVFYTYLPNGGLNFEHPALLPHVPNQGPFSRYTISFSPSTIL